MREPRPNGEVRVLKQMPKAADIPFFSELVPGGIEYGSVLLVEFEPHSCWYDAAYTIAAQSLRKGLKTDLHIFQHNPKEVKEAVRRFGLDVENLEGKDTLRFIDSFSVQVGVNTADIPKGADAFKTSSVRIEDWGKAARAQISEAIPESEKNRVHIDDNTAILVRYNKEDDVVDYWRTRIIPLYKERGGVLVNAVALGVASESFYRQHESLADGIMDCRSQEVNGVVEHYVRMRTFRGKTPDSKWRRVSVLSGGEVVLEERSRAGSASASRAELPAAEKSLAAFLEAREGLNLSRYAVAGSYVRYDDPARHLLKDLRSKIIGAFASGSPKHENYLVWAPPGSGKTSFIRQIGQRLAGVVYRESNLAETNEAEFRRTLADVSRSPHPTLLLIDEVDSREHESWPYEAMLAYLEADADEARHVYVMAGSSGSSLQSMKERIAFRPKGKDLLSRVPIGNEYSVPEMSLFDNVLVFLSCLNEAASRSGRRIEEVEKLGLYYVATSSQLDNPRTLREFALRCVERVPVGDARLKYDNMFDAGDRANKEFWVNQSPRVPALVNSFLRVEREDRSVEVEGERRLAAIMFTDMVGFTAIAQRDEALAMDLIQEQRSLMRPFFSKHGGREVKTIGDAFLVEFASSLEAVKCAAEIQTALREANAKCTEEKKILVRIGIHLGDVIHYGTDVAGDAVNVASRIEPLAPPGGVSVSGQVHDSVANKVPYQFESLGRPQLKNVANQIEVFKVLGYGEKAPPQSPTLPSKDRIAVLPLTNISNNVGDEYFADGMTEELISSVSKTQGLRVIARTSVMKYKGSNKSIAEIGKELNVASLLEGSVRKAGDKVRITVQLVDTSNEEPRWSQEYDRELKDIFSIQSDIAHNVAEALRVQMLSAAARETPEPTSNMEAYILYLRGRQHWNRRTKADLEQAVRLFEDALKIDPRYARAFAGLADAYAMLASYATEYLPPGVAYPKAGAAVQSALEIDSELVEAHTSLGVVKFHYDWDWDGAEAEFKRAIDLGPSYAPAHQFYSDHLKAVGRLDEALREVRKAQELDPLSLPINSAVGHVLYLSRRYDAAIEQYRKVVELDPNFMQTHIWFGRPLLEKGMFEEALAELRTGVRLSGESNVSLGMLGHGLASAGKTEEALEIVQKLKERSKTQYVSSYWIASVYNGMKDRESTVSWLRKAFGERSSWLVWCNVEPRFDWLRHDADFKSLVGAMRFP